MRTNRLMAACSPARSPSRRELPPAAGVFLRGNGAYDPSLSVRGETYEMATDGVYAFNAMRVVAEGIGWDVFTLAVAAPVLLITSIWVAAARFVAD